jgi:hypothetical protein
MIQSVADPTEGEHVVNARQCELVPPQQLGLPFFSWCHRMRDRSIQVIVPCYRADSDGCCCCRGNV